MGNIAGSKAENFFVIVWTCLKIDSIERFVSKKGADILNNSIKQALSRFD